MQDGLSAGGNAVPVDPPSEVGDVAAAPPQPEVTTAHVMTRSGAVRINGE